MNKEQLKEIIKNQNIKIGDIVELYVDDGSVWTGKYTWEDINDEDLKFISIDRKGFPRNNDDIEPGQKDFSLNKIENILKYKL